MKLKLDTPAGLVEVEAEITNGKVTRVTFQNVPAFAVHLDKAIEVPQLGTVTVDVAYGGMFYVIADAAALGLRLMPDEARDLVRVGRNDQGGSARAVARAASREPGNFRNYDRAAFRAFAEHRKCIEETR